VFLCWLAGFPTGHFSIDFKLGLVYNVRSSFFNSAGGAKECSYKKAPKKEPRAYRGYAYYAEGRANVVPI
jgi:hypothetical protein